MLICALFLPPCSPAQQQNKLTVQQPAALTLKRGASAVAVVHVSVLPGFHVNSDKPKDEFLIPLQLTWTQGGALRAGVTAYPPAQDVQVGDGKLSVFTGDFDLRTPVSAASDAAAGAATLTGKVHYQACNDRMCFRPVTVELHLPVVIE